MKIKPKIMDMKKKDLDPCALEIHDSLESRIERIKNKKTNITPSHNCPLTIHDSIESRIERMNKY
ncbi:hypothetical protein [Methanonatronarchaeum sp. AMET6-2]|uniref:hypothetical protein n=1 Tax=Methanonatronarchaeum sp. AMET6-2 TaxID=2933293 RepID=UPI0011F51815|nr:hypothetical protein [Methanonatronarchaeum sp. AMET6-2]RZN61794.1 MAG: hypothetical protein EF811_04520 [Methanonatronarchaeia archaeon]UOY10212.1 hypothetical protein MU439_00825 [Methanonatronarchaeum sp. AMET6-2]